MEGGAPHSCLTAHSTWPRDLLPSQWGRAHGSGSHPWGSMKEDTGSKGGDTDPKGKRHVQTTLVNHKRADPLVLSPGPGWMGRAVSIG